MYAEAERVPAFKGVCDSAAPAEEKIAQLGALMDDSQASCRRARLCMLSTAFLSSNSARC